MKNKLIILLAFAVIFIVACNQQYPKTPAELQERSIFSCEECNENETCWNSLDNKKSCKEKTESEWEREKQMETYNCHKGCDNFNGREEIISKSCQCLNKNNVEFTFDFECGRTQSCSLSFEDKKKMAIIDDNWYCVCNEVVEGYYCEQTRNPETKCTDIEYKERTINRTTEFIWKY